MKAKNDAAIESYKAKLKSESDIELERLRSELSIMAAERNIRFNALHNKRADIVANVYSLLKTVYITLEDYVKIFEPAGDRPRTERRQSFAEAHAELRKVYPPRMIFLPKATASKLQSIDMEFVKTFNEFALTVDHRDGPGDAKKWLQIFERVQSEMNETLAELEDEFRGLLGDDG